MIIGLVLIFTAQIATEPAPVGVDQLEPAPYQRGRFNGLLADRRLTEASGLTASRLIEGRYWVINDGGNDPLLFAVNEHGVSQGTVSLDGVSNTDWEDLASCSLDGHEYLAVGDIGDNGGLRRNLLVHLVEEPEDPRGQALAPVRSLRIRLEDGPHDVESLACDSERRVLLLLTKRMVPAVMYEAPLSFDGPDEVVARPVGRVLGIPQPTEEEKAADPRMGHHRSQPTAMDLSWDGSLLAVLTYRHAYLYRRPAGASWAEVLARLPGLIRLPPLPVGEALALDGSGRLLITTEQWPAPVVLVEPTP